MGNIEDYVKRKRMGKKAEAKGEEIFKKSKITMKSPKKNLIRSEQEKKKAEDGDEKLGGIIEMEKGNGVGD